MRRQHHQAKAAGREQQAEDELHRSMGLMAIVNLVAIILLSGTVIKLAKDYNRQLKEGKLPTFDANEYPELKSQLEEGIWYTDEKKK